ncbi:MAG: glutathione S-transferase N-terminal domain-containing protein [Nannocystaceae bacterium]|nr:glutathione S-transferase N-terminal domain-containing protein [Nannocystaceae bacterium]
MVVHHLEHSRSHRVLWLLEELGLEYELEVHRRHPTTMRAPPELRKIHPLGRAPIMVIDGEVLAESGAIIEHCVETFDDGKLAPKSGTADARRYRYWMHFAEGSMMAPLLVRLIFDKIKSAPLPFFIKPIASGIVKKVETNYTKPEIDNHLSFVESQLADRDFFAGDAFSSADIQMSYPVQAALSRGRSEVSTKNLTAWVARIRERPGYLAADARGGPSMGLG